MTTVNFALSDSSTTQNSIGIISVGSRIFLNLGQNLLLPAETKFWPRLYFYTCLSFCSQGGRGGEYLTRYTPPDQVHPPGPGTPPGTRYTPRDQIHPPGPGTPPRDQVPPHPPPPAANSGIRSTIGRYASYWNAFLFSKVFC